MKKKVLIIVFLIMLIISIFQISTLYAIYKTEKSGEYAAEIGAFKIKIYDHTLNEEVVEEYRIPQNKIYYEESPNVIAGKIAPGTKGYFDLEIDAEGSDVSVLVDLIMTAKDETSVDYQITGFESSLFRYNETEEIEETEETIGASSDYELKSVIPLEKIKQGYKERIRVYFRWSNNEKNNELDTKIGESLFSEDRIVSIYMQAKFLQYTGEDITFEEEEEENEEDVIGNQISNTIEDNIDNVVEENIVENG